MLFQKNITKLAGEHSYWNFFFNNVVGNMMQAWNWTKKRLPQKCSPMNFEHKKRLQIRRFHVKFLNIPMKTPELESLLAQLQA